MLGMVHDEELPAPRQGSGEGGSERAGQGGGPAGLSCAAHLCVPVPRTAFHAQPPLPCPALHCSLPPPPPQSLTSWTGGGSPPRGGARASCASCSRAPCCSRPSPSPSWCARPGGEGEGEGPASCRPCRQPASCGPHAPTAPPPAPCLLQILYSDSLRAAVAPKSADPFFLAFAILVSPAAAARVQSCSSSPWPCTHVLPALPRLLSTAAAACPSPPAPQVIVFFTLEAGLTCLANPHYAKT